MFHICETNNQRNVTDHLQYFFSPLYYSCFQSYELLLTSLIFSAIQISLVFLNDGANQIFVVGLIMWMSASCARARKNNSNFSVAVQDVLSWFTLIKTLELTYYFMINITNVNCSLKPLIQQIWRLIMTLMGWIHYF